MIAQSEILVSLKDIVRVAGEVFGIFAVGALVGVIGAIRRQKKSLRWSSIREKMFVEKHTAIHELLTELRVTVRASRAAVFQFHNGGNFVDGGSIKRFSITHESCDIGVNSVILDSQDVLLTRYADMITLMDTLPSKIVSVSSLSHTPFRSALEINNVEYFTISPLKCEDGITPLGFLCCQWCSSEELDQIKTEGVSENSVESVILQTAHNINAHLTHESGKN